MLRLSVPLPNTRSTTIIGNGELGPTAHIYLFISEPLLPSLVPLYHENMLAKRGARVLRSAKGEVEIRFFSGSLARLTILGISIWGVVHMNNLPT